MSTRRDVLKRGLGLALCRFFGLAENLAAGPASQIDPQKADDIISTLYSLCQPHYMHLKHHAAITSSLSGAVSSLNGWDNVHLCSIARKARPIAEIWNGEIEELRKLAPQKSELPALFKAFMEKPWANDLGDERDIFTAISQRLLSMNNSQRQQYFANMQAQEITLHNAARRLCELNGIDYSDSNPDRKTLHITRHVNLYEVADMASAAKLLRGYSAPPDIFVVIANRAISCELKNPASWVERAAFTPAQTRQHG